MSQFDEGLSESERREFQEFLDHARTDMFPKLKDSALAIIINGDPDPKLCLELGAAILFDKPILVLAPRGWRVPLSLRGVAHKIVETDSPPGEADRAAVGAALAEMMEAGRFRGPSGDSAGRTKP